MQEQRDDAVGLVSLLLDTAVGFRRITGPQFERQHELPSQSFEVLVRLAHCRDGRMRMTELACRTSLTPSGLTRAVDRLQSAGLVERCACDEDRRGAYAALSPLGKKRVHHALTCHREDLECALADCLDQSERAELVALLKRLRERVNPTAAGT